MNKISKQHGFGAAEIVIIVAVLGLLGLIGWRFIQNQQTKPPPKVQTNKTTSSATDTSQIVATVKAHDSAAGTDITVLEVKVIKFSADKKFAYYTAGPSTGGGGWAGVAWKDQDKWAVIHEGQEGPSCKIANQYKIPKEIVETCFDDVQSKFVPNTN